MESSKVANLIQLNKSIIERNINLKNQIGYDSLKDNILISNDTYLVSFKEKNYNHYQLQVVKRNDLEELKRKLDSETNENKKKYLMDLYNKKRIGTQYYYREQNDFMHICHNSNIECQRYYL